MNWTAFMWTTITLIATIAVIGVGSFVAYIFKEIRSDTVRALIVLFVILVIAACVGVVL